MHPLNVAGSVAVKRGVPALGATLKRQLMKLKDAGNEVQGHYPLGGTPSFQMRKQAQRRKAFAQGCTASLGVGASQPVLTLLLHQVCVGLNLALPLPDCDFGLLSALLSAHWEI